MSRIAFRNFTGGEVTPTLCARYDLKKFGTFLETCRNFVPNLHGDVERRPGTKYIADLGTNSILLPFQFNTDPSNNYVLIFQSGTIKIAQADGLLEATLANPYSMSHVHGISFAQVADVLYLAHPQYALRKITRASQTIRKAAVIVVAGQSNAVGYSEAAGPISAGGHYWDNDARAWKTPVKDPVFPSGTGGFVPAMVQKLNESGRTVYVVNVARGGSNCASDYRTAADRNWGPGGTLRSRAKSMVSAALSNIGEPYDVIGTVWLQGETDASYIYAGLETQNDYNSTVAKTLQFFHTEIGGGVFVSYIAYYANTAPERDAVVDAVNARLLSVTQSYSWCRLATTLPATFRESGKLKSDGVHYLQSTYDELGTALGAYVKPYAAGGEIVVPGEYVWNIQTVSINQSLPAPGKPTVTWHRGEGDGNTDNETAFLRYVVTSVDDDGVESVASPVGRCKARYPTDWIVGDYVTVSWPAVDGASEYNVYRESAGYYGFIGTSTTISFEDQNYEPDTAQTPKKNWNPFANGNNPSSVCFHQQRMWLGGGAKNPASIYASRTGDYESFRKSSPLQDDDALEYVLASGSIDDVKWLVSFDSLLVGTAGAEYKASSSKSSAITPSDCQITVQSYWGSRDLQPLIIGQSIMHAQRSGSHVRDLYYTLESDGYAGNDLSVLAPQLVETSAIVQWCYQQSPSSCVWAVRADGVLLCLTYMKEQNVFGWSRHVTDGKVKSVAVINGSNEDIVMMVVQRTINGTTKYYLERLMSRFRENDGIADAWYVDAGKVIAGTSVTNDADGKKVVCSGFQHLAGKKVQVLSDGSPEEHTVSSSGGFELEFPVTSGSKILVGLGYDSVLCPLPPEVDMDKGGSTLGKRRAYGKCIARMYRSVGGSYAASRPNDLWNTDAWKQLDFYELPFLPAKWGEACQPYSGDLEISLPSGQDPDTTIWFKQDKPLPMRIVALTADVEFGEI